MAVYTLRLSNETRAALNALARRERLSPSAYVRKALNELMEKAQ